MPKFLITQLPIRTQLNIAGAPAVINQEYDFSLQSTLEVINTFGFPAEPTDFFKYKVKSNNGILSLNEGTIKVNFLVDGGSIGFENIIEEINLFESINFTDFISLNSSWDRIVIYAIEERQKGQWLLGGIPINIGQVIMNYNLANLTFISSTPGSTNLYNKLKFKFASKNNESSSFSYFTINTVSLAELNLEPIQEFDDELVGYNEILNGFEVSNAPENATYKLSVDTTNFSGIGIDPENRVVVNYSGIQSIITTSTVLEITGTLDVSGSIQFDSVIEQTKPYLTAGSTIVITLLEINGGTALINPLKNQITININNT